MPPTCSAGERYESRLSGPWPIFFVQVHGDEVPRSKILHWSRPEGVVLLIDTYDTEASARKVVQLAPKLKADGIDRFAACASTAVTLVPWRRRSVRILDAGGTSDVIIVVSGGINEDVLQTLMASKAPIDGYGIGVNLDASIDAPLLIVPTNFRNTPANHGANFPKAKPHGREANRSGAAMALTGE